LRGQSNDAGLRGLSRRIAFLPLRLKGITPGRLVAGMLATWAFLSMWISNTARWQRSRAFTRRSAAMRRTA